MSKSQPRPCAKRAGLFVQGEVFVNSGADRASS